MKKKIMIALVAGALSISGAYAQNAPSDNRGDRGKERMEALYKELNVTPEQKEKLTKLNDESRAKMMAIRDDKDLSDDQKKEKMMTLRKEQKEKRDAVLTPEQVAKWDEKMKEWRQQNQKREGDKKE